MNVSPLHDRIIVQRLMKENDVLAIADGRPPADVAGGM
jgi:hypothetical protein